MSAEEAAETPSGAESQSAEARDDSGSVVLLDPTLEEAAARDLEGALGRPVVVWDADRLREKGPPEGVAALVVPWELPTRCGLEVVEQIRRLEPPVGELPIIVASSSPTRARVQLALRAGANSFAFRPYHPEELRERLSSIEPGAEPSSGEKRDVSI